MTLFPALHFTLQDIFSCFTFSLDYLILYLFLSDCSSLLSYLSFLLRSSSEPFREKIELFFLSTMPRPMRLTHGVDLFSSLLT